MALGVLRKAPGTGRSTAYELADGEYVFVGLPMDQYPIPIIIPAHQAVALQDQGCGTELACCRTPFCAPC